MALHEPIDCEDLPQGATFLHGCSGSLLGLGQTVFRRVDGAIVLRMDEPDGTFMMCRTQFGVVVDTTVDGMIYNMEEEGATPEECTAAANLLRGLLQHAHCEPRENHLCSAACAKLW